VINRRTGIKHLTAKRLTLRFLSRPLPVDLCPLGGLLHGSGRDRNLNVRHRETKKMTDGILTDEARVVIDIFSKVHNKLARVLFYQCVFHVELFKKASQLLKEAKEELDFENFARSQSCHMTEGLFGADRHAAKMETAKIRTLGYLGVTVSAGHKLLRSLKNARNKEPRPEWRTDRKALIALEEDYRFARNAYQHLDEAICKGVVVKTEDFSFSIHDVLQFRDNHGARRTLDFSPGALQQLSDIWWRSLAVLGAEKLE
jgi:hypothetical protein